MRKQSGMIFFLGLTLVLSSCASPASTPTFFIPTQPQPTTPAATPTITLEMDLGSKLQTALQPLADTGKLSGAVLVAKNGKVVFSQAYGLADVENKLVNSLDTKFHLGTLSKQFTAMAILLLQQQGKLNVQDPVCNYIDDCPPAWAPITIHELLIHTSGIHEFNNIPGIEKLIDQRVTPLQIVDQFRDLPLNFTPGEKYSFSNSGYMLLGVIIEEASGQTYGDFVQHAIFDPLQMKNSGYEDDDSTGPEFALGYRTGDTPAPFVDKSINYSSAGLYSTVGDLLLWDQSFYTGALLPVSMQAEIFKYYVPIPNTTLGAGYGWNIGTQYDQTWFYYSSKSPGAAGILHRFPSSKVTVIVLTNRQDSDLQGANALIGPIIFGGPWVSPIK
jgi:CubicO group peptidase (beta-lactamase class C family)